jgi:hypothetical protein
MLVQLVIVRAEALSVSITLFNNEISFAPVQVLKVAVRLGKAKGRSAKGAKLALIRATDGP